MGKNVYHVHIKYKGIDQLDIPAHDQIYRNGVSYRLARNGFVEDYECVEGGLFETNFYLWHHQYEYQSYAIFDGKGNPLKVQDEKAEEFDRSYKDLYWYYSANQDYWTCLSFVMPSQDVHIEVTYALMKTASVLEVNVDRIKPFLKPGSSYLHCLKETYNLSRHHFDENDVYHYECGDKLTFVIALKEPKQVLLSMDGKTYEPVLVEDDGKTLYFGTLDTIDDFDDEKDPRSVDIYPTQGRSKAAFILKD